MYVCNTIKVCVHVYACTCTMYVSDMVIDNTCSNSKDYMYMYMFQGNSNSNSTCN